MVIYSKKATGGDLSVGCLIVTAYTRIRLGFSSLFFIYGIGEIKDPLASTYRVSIGAIIWYNLTKSLSNSEICNPLNDIGVY